MPAQEASYIQKRRLKKSINVGEQELYLRSMYDKDYEDIKAGPGNFPDMEKMNKL